MNGVVGCTNLPRKAENQEEEDAIISYRLPYLKFAEVFVQIREVNETGCCLLLLANVSGRSWLGDCSFLDFP